MPSAENPNVTTIHLAFQLQNLIEAGHKNASFIDPTTLKLIHSITDSHPEDEDATKTPQWAASKEGVQKKVSSFLDGVIGVLKVKEMDLEDSDEEDDEDYAPSESGDSEEYSDDDSEEESGSEDDSEYSDSDDEHTTLDRISEDEDEDIDAIPKTCLDAKLGEGIILHEISGRKIALYGNKVVKSGRNLRISEAEAMKFVASKTSIPIPKIYDAETDGKLTTITMEFIEGDRLDRVWNYLTEASKSNIAAQLNDILSQLRSLKGKYIGGINCHKAMDSRRYDLEGGPFETEADFNEFLLSDAYPQVPKCFLQMAEHSLLTNHAIVFTHGDLAPRNIIVRDDQVVGLLDWENAGWYPEYWDFVKTFNALDQRCNWYDYVDKIFPVAYEQEFMNDRFVGTLVRHGHS